MKHRESNHETVVAVVGIQMPWTSKLRLLIFDL
jgi:hypothetical protein